MTMDNTAKKEELNDDGGLDPFELAFGEVAQEEPPNLELVTEEPKVEEPKVEEPKVEEPKDEEPKDEEPKDEEPKVEETKPKTEAELRLEVKANLEEQARLDEEKAAQEAKTKTAAEELAARATMTEEELALQASVEGDFKDITQLMAVANRIAEAKFESKLADLEQRMQEQLAPVFETTQAVASNAHEAAILKEHEDAFDILPKVTEWIDSQPKFLHATYSGILESGTAEDVVELFTAYKATLPSDTPPGPTPEEAAAKKSAEADAALAKKKKLDSMAGVRTAAIQNTEGIDENDFEGGFAASASKA